MQKLIASIASRLVIAVPYFWLLVFFLVPFFIVFKISLSEVAMAIRPMCRPSIWHRGSRPVGKS